MLPLHHSTPLIVHKQPSPPLSHLSTTIVQSPTSPPVPSTTPPPSSLSDVTSSTRIRRSFDQTNAQPAEVVKKSSDARNYRLPTLTRPGYSMEPSMLALKSMFNEQGQCLVEQFKVAHDKYGSVMFYGKVDLAGLNLDEISKYETSRTTNEH
jgi:hypothetical protein